MTNYSLLSQLVSIPSEYPHEHKIVQFVSKYLNKQGFTVSLKTVEGQRKNVFAFKGQGDASILFFGHLDTVSVIEAKKWTTNPLKCVKKGGRYYGLGVADMKSGISAFINAAAQADGPVKIFLSVDEENISQGAWKAVKENKSFFKEVKLIISAESSFGQDLSEVTLGRSGRYIFQVEFIGQSEHIIRYRDGIDAIQELGSFVNRLYAERDRLFVSPDTVAQVRKVEGESIGMSVAAAARAEVEVLLSAEDTVSSVQRALKKLTDAKITLQSRPTPYLEAYRFNSFPYQDEIGAIIKKYTGQEMSLRNRKSVGDDNVLATLGIPVITWGPKGGNEHRPNEYVEIQSLGTLVKMYQELLAIHGEKS